MEGYVQEYSVYALNKEKTGKYFTVIFNFEDKWGYKDSESVTQYVKAGERKRFYYRDVQEDGNEIINWDYKIVPEKY